VAYTVKIFVEKNNDKLPNEIHALFSTSLVGMVSKELFQEQGEDKKKARSVVAKFTSNIKDLIQTLESTKVSFIRCVKPNAEMKRDSTSNAWFNRKYVSMQLRCLSVPQTANVLRSGLPTRIPYASIASQYKQALSEDAVRIWKQRGAGSEKQFTAALFWAFEIDESIYRLGFSKVFFKSGQLSQLDHVMQATTNWTPAEKDRVGKRFKLYYIRLMWRNACRKVMCQNRFLQLFYLAKRRAMAASKVTAFFRMVGPRKRFLKHYAAQISLRKKESDRIKEENLAKERAEKQRQLELQREQELKKQEEQERAALVLQMERNKELARMAEQQREEARREEERKTQERMASAEGKRLEAEKLHRQALAAQILAEAALAEQRAYEESVRKGKEMTMEERSKALDHFEAEYASQMAKYEARRKYYGNLQNLAKQELLNYNQKITDFLNSDQVKQAMDKAKQVLDSVKAWAYTRFDHFSTPEGRQLEAEAALQKYRETSEKARIAAMRARELLNEQLKDNPWYTKALEQKDRIREMASKVKYRTSSSTRTIIGGANKVVIDKQEWTQPIVSASNQTDRLRVLLDANMITPDEYARLVGTLMEQVETKHESEVVHHVKKQSTMGIQLLCPQCGKEANSTSKKCVHCFAVLIKPQETVSFSLEERWTVPVHGAHGHAFRCRISGVETVLDPDTYMESKLFVVEACNGDGGDSSVFWKVAHPFSDFIHIHRELMEAKSTYITKEAKALIPDFPQAKPDPARRRSSASNLLAMFGKKKKNTISEVGGGVLLTGSDKQSTVKSGEQFLANYLQGLFSAVEVHAAKEDKLGENMLLRFKPMDVFLHFEENTKSQL
jgi:myosin heavy subunit